MTDDLVASGATNAAVRILHGLSRGTTELPGVSLQTLAEGLPPVGPDIYEIVVRSGREFMPMLRPLLQAAANGQIVLGGVAPPPEADPIYILFVATVALDFTYNARSSTAQSTWESSLTYAKVRAFTPAEAEFVRTCGGKLRPMPRTTPQPPVAPRRTGCAGRPSSADLCEAEMRLRADAGTMLPKIGQEAEHLVAWLKITHPKEVLPKAKSLSDAIRAEYNGLKSRKS